MQLNALYQNVRSVKETKNIQQHMSSKRLMMGSLYNVPRKDSAKPEPEEPEQKVVVSQKKIRPYSKIVKFNAAKPVAAPE